jgi:hypothetical protein
MEFLQDNAAELIFAALAFVKVVVNLTPTEKDNEVFAKIDRFINALIPDRRK